MSEGQFTSEELSAIRRYQAARGDDVPADDPLRREVLFYMDQARGQFKHGADRGQVVAKLAEIRDGLGHAMPDEILREIVTDVHELDNIDDGENDHPTELIEEAGGALGTFTQHIVETAPAPNPWLALPAAIALMAVVLSQKIQSVGGVRSNLYVLPIARPSGGKDHPRQKIKQVLYSTCKDGEHYTDALVGPENINSGAGFLEVIRRQRCVLFLIDEFGKVLQSIRHTNAPQYAKEVIQYFLSLWSTTSGTWRANALKKTDELVVVDSPCVSLMGSTTPDAFWRAISRESMVDGFLSRMLPFETLLVPYKREIPLTDPPGDVLQLVERWKEYVPGGNTGSVIFQPRTLDLTVEAKGLFDAFVRDCCDRSRAITDCEGSALWGRAHEKALKLGMIHACSRSFDATAVDTPAMRWAIQLVEFCTSKFLASAGDHLADNQTEDEANRVYRTIREAMPSGIEKQELTRKTQFLNSKRRNEVIEGLREAGKIIIVGRPTKGRAGVVYLAL